MNSVPSGAFTQENINKEAKNFGPTIEQKGYDLKKKYMDLVIELKKNIKSDGSSDKESDENTIGKLKNDLQSARYSLQSKKNDLQKAEDKLTTLKTDQQKQKIEIDLAVKKAKNAVDDLMDNVELSNDLQKDKDALEEAQETLKKTLKEYEDYQIVSNFDGLVTKVEMQV